MKTPPDPGNASARTLASQLRRRMGGTGEPLKAEEVSWFASYEDALKGGTGGRPAQGASRARKMTHTEEEIEAVGTGDAAAIAASAAAGASREEGRRLDYVMTIGMDALARACTLHEKMAASLLQTTVKNLEAQTGLLETVRTHYLERVQAEGDAARMRMELERAAEGEGDELMKMVEPFLPIIMKKLGHGVGK